MRFSGNKLNGITFGGVGDATEVDFVQVHNNQDDCGVFGGTVNGKHLICTNAGDTQSRYRLGIPRKNAICSC